MKPLFTGVRSAAPCEQSLRSVTRASNELLFRLVRDAACQHEFGTSMTCTENALAMPRDRLLERLAQIAGRA